jgi:phosphoribosylamine--glycine ligase
LAWSLSSSGVPIIVSPGNGGVSAIPNTTTAPYTGVEGAVRLCKGARLVVVGPEAPLADGICDALAKEGIPCFGPTAAAARLETSKAWSKDFMVRAGIPTAAHASFTSLAQAEAYIKAAPHRVVVKASGLCAGKGVVVARDTAEALEAVRGMMGGSFGEAGKEVVIEEFLEGVEASVLAVCDGTSVFPFPAAQDHKRAWEFDEGEWLVTWWWWWEWCVCVASFYFCYFCCSFRSYPTFKSHTRTHAHTRMHTYSHPRPQHGWYGMLCPSPNR